MATVTQTRSIATASGNYFLYDLEPTGGFATPDTPTFTGGGRDALPNDRRVDVLVLGDGYTAADQSTFEAHLDEWYETFAAIWPYSQFLPAFRVRGVFVESTERASASRKSFYKIELNGSGNVKKGLHEDGEVREAIWETLAVVESGVGLNTVRYPEELELNWSGDGSQREARVIGPRDRSTCSGLSRRAVVALLVLKDSGSGSPDPGSGSVFGYHHFVQSPDTHRLEGRVAVAFGRRALHEFSHAFALLLDEYIGRRGTPRRWVEHQQNPSHGSVFELWNLTFTTVGDAVPWRHLAWDALTPRDPGYVGQLWVGGSGKDRKSGDEGAWHSEYKCLMNGESNHPNYHHRRDETRPDADLRTRRRLCIWCEEIVTIRILEKTGLLRRPGDPDDDDAARINELGRIWYRRWVDELRPAYWQEFDLDQRILDREAFYQNPSNLLVMPSSGVVWDGDLTGTDLMRDITDAPAAGPPLALGLCAPLVGEA